MTDEARVRVLNDGPLDPEGAYVFYWMTAARRPTWNHALERAVSLATELERPLLVFEALSVDLPWASERFHAFVIDGMMANARAFAERNIAYHPYIEPEPGAGRGLVAALAERACVSVTDDYPAYVLPALTRAAAEQIDGRLEAVDANGIVPIRAPEKEYKRAYDFRRYLQRTLPEHLTKGPAPDPLADAGPAAGPVEMPEKVSERWPAAELDRYVGGWRPIVDLPIDHEVLPTECPGGFLAARERLEAFVSQNLETYHETSAHPDERSTSRLSPHLHFGHISAWEILDRIIEAEGWTPGDLGDEARGKREGWWGMGPGAEAYLEQLVTWRELGFNTCVQLPDANRYESLPDWAKKTLAEHEADDRDPCYDLETLEAADTHDDLWNAAQRQLKAEGTIHNSLRMLWGKKILEWSPAPEAALERLIHLNNRWSLDGRDPNSTSGIFWTLGRYDRPFGPERPIFGKVRYMSSKNSKRKWKVREYLEQWGP